MAAALGGALAAALAPGVPAAVATSAAAASVAAPAAPAAPPTAPPAPAATAAPAASAEPAAALARGPGRRSATTFLIIPRLHKRLRVREGVSQRVLALGVGHYPGTARPGAIGNVVLLGHRTTHTAPFRRLHRLRNGDPLVLAKGKRRHTYRVYRKTIMSPRRRSVLAPVPFRPDAAPRTRSLTLITCHPPGSERQRLVVLAKSDAG
jgi:sortase A